MKWPSFFIWCFFLSLSLPFSAAHATPKKAILCKQNIEYHALQLLRFHSAGDERSQIDTSDIEVLPSLKNPLRPKQRFTVYQVHGWVYKGHYRIRLIYWVHAPEDCTLMGQEILELARF